MSEPGPNALEQLTQWLYVLILTFTSCFALYFCMLVFPTDSFASLVSLCQRRKKRMTIAIGSQGEKIVVAASSVASMTTRLAVSKFIRE